MNRNSEEAQSNNPGVDQTQFQNQLQNNQQYCIQVYNVVNTTKNKIIHIGQTPDVQHFGGAEISRVRLSKQSKGFSSHRDSQKAELQC